MSEGVVTITDFTCAVFKINKEVYEKVMSDLNTELAKQPSAVIIRIDSPGKIINR